MTLLYYMTIFCDLYHSWNPVSLVRLFELTIACCGQGGSKTSTVIWNKSFLSIWTFAQKFFSGREFWWMFRDRETITNNAEESYEGCVATRPFSCLNDSKAGKIWSNPSRGWWRKSIDHWILGVRRNRADLSLWLFINMSWAMWWKRERQQDIRKKKQMWGNNFSPIGYNFSCIRPLKAL